MYILTLLNSERLRTQLTLEQHGLNCVGSLICGIFSHYILVVYIYIYIYIYIHTYIYIYYSTIYILQYEFNIHIHIHTHIYSLIAQLVKTPLAMQETPV